VTAMADRLTRSGGPYRGGSRAEAELVGDLELKGFHEPIRVYNVAGLK
jgi:class 3 adenylate cyclase